MSDKKSVLYHIIICLIAMILAILLVFAPPLFMILFGFIGLAYGALSYKLTNKIMLPNIMLGAFLFLGLVVLDMTKTQDDKTLDLLMLISAALVFTAFLVSYTLTLADKKLRGDWDAGRYKEKNAIGYILIVLSPVLATWGAYFAESLDRKYGGPLLVYVVCVLPIFVLLGGILPYLFTGKKIVPCAIWSGSAFFTSVASTIFAKTNKNIRPESFLVNFLGACGLFVICVVFSFITEKVFGKTKIKNNKDRVALSEENENSE